MKKRKKPGKLRPVMIIWEDSAACPGWHSKKEMRQQLSTAVQCCTVGLLLKKNKKMFSVVQNATVNQYGDGFVIPRSVVKEWAYLK